MPPAVSVIVATYNRSGVLRHTLESLRRNTFTDWECWVIGDRCTDDTGAVVASFGDSRVRFVNLDTRHGEQTVPNTVGLGYATGRYVAWLNHDDLWLPDHLEQAVSGLEETGADLVFAPVIMVEPDGSRRLLGVSQREGYEPHLTVPASSWVLRRELVDAIGPWRQSREIYNLPSQEWIARAHRARATLRALPMATVVSVYSAVRPGSYRRSDEPEQAAIARRMADGADFRERELMAVARTLDRLDHGIEALPTAGRAVAALFRRLCVRAGAHPYSVRNLLRYGRRGGMIAHFMRLRGVK